MILESFWNGISLAGVCGGVKSKAEEGEEKSGFVIWCVTPGGFKTLGQVGKQTRVATEARGVGWGCEVA